MKVTKKTMASAIAFAVGLSTASAGLATNQWFAVTLESGYTTGGAVTNGTQAGGAWLATGTSEASKVVTLSGESLTTAGQATGNIIKLDGQGDSLKWTPSNASTGVVVFVDTDVYMVGSDEVPTTSATGVQTEVYLTNYLNSSYVVTNSALCVHVGNGAGGNVWKQLSGVAITNQTWVRLRIEIDYTVVADPQVYFYVNGTQMYNGADYHFDTMMVASGITSVSFMGTGYVDNFVGKQATTFTEGPTFSTGNNTNGVAGAVGGSNYSVSSVNKTVTAVWNETVDGVGAIKYVQLASTSTGYKRTVRTSEGGVVSFSTANLAAGTYTLTGFYGEAAPTVIPAGYKPAAEPIGEYKAAAITNGVLSLTFAPVSGLYYTPFVGTTDLADLKAASASVLASPADEDNGFLQINLPVPATAWGVNLIKIYASDAPYAKDATP